MMFPATNFSFHEGNRSKKTAMDEKIAQLQLLKPQPGAEEDVLDGVAWSLNEIHRIGASG